MLIARSIQREWVEQALNYPALVEIHDNNQTVHYLKKIAENENRWLRVVVNREKIPHKAVTTFFDRRLRRKQ